MKINTSSYRKIIAVIGIALLAVGGTRSSRADFLYVGDVGDDTVKRYDATTQAFQGDFVSPSSGGLHGPRGLIFNQSGDLLVANQNVNLDVNGEILKYNGVTGMSTGALVPQTDPNAPFAPRGIVLRENRLYVASIVGEDKIGAFGNGKVFVYKQEGTFLGDLKPSHKIISGGLFHPRGLVFGPDGLLYVSNWRTLTPGSGNILRFDPEKGAYLGVFASNDNYPNFSAPEGLVFGPDGNLYTTSFRADVSDTDKIVIFAGPGKPNPGKFLMGISLDEPGVPIVQRNRAIALLFGPDGSLYVPIYHADAKGNPNGHGEIRRYNVDVLHNTFTVSLFVGPSGPGDLHAPWYLTFGKTDPATLAYPTP